MKKWIGKLDKKVIQGSGEFTETDIMKGHKRLIRDPKEGEREAGDAVLLAQIQELNRQNQELMPKPEPSPKKGQEEKPLTTMQQRKKKGPTGQWGVYD